MKTGLKTSGGEGGIRTLGTGVSPYNGLANRRIRPLCHLSDLGGQHFDCRWKSGAVQSSGGDSGEHKVLSHDERPVGQQLLGSPVSLDPKPMRRGIMMVV